jgi:hypothetical protein
MADWSAGNLKGIQRKVLMEKLELRLNVLVSLLLLAVSLNIASCKNDKACPTVMVYLTGQKLNLTIPFPGNYFIIIKGPGGANISRQITMN